MEDLIGEKLISHIWDGGHFIRHNLRAKDGRRIEIISRGKWNEDSGADFINAKIKIGNKIYTGDVEIHLRNSDWRVHHHDRDPNYNSTILHVAFWDGGFSLLTKKQNGDRIPTLILSDYLDRSIGKLWKDMSIEKSLRYGCKITPESLDKAGMDRFFQKAKIFATRMNDVGEDQLLYESIMEALGYSKNRNPFIDLAQKAPLRMLFGYSPEKIQAILFDTAGLLPDKRQFDEETLSYLSEIEPAIWGLKIQDRMPAKAWRFFRIRPSNFPTKRIAAMSFIISSSEKSLMELFLLAFRMDKDERISIPDRLVDILAPRAYGYWTTHYIFGERRHAEKQFLIGKDRASDIIINSILPVILAYAQRKQNIELQNLVMKIYTDYGRLQDNRITRYFADKAFQNNEKYASVVNSALRQQGLIHIYKNYCIDNDCCTCPLFGGLTKKSS